MKRRYLQLCAAVFALIALTVAVFIGCSSAYRESSTRMQTSADMAQSPRAVYSAKNPVPVTQDPTGRHVIEGGPIRNIQHRRAGKICIGLDAPVAESIETIIAREELPIRVVGN